jgi:ribonucleoside-diphosphate reductase alpha chain
MPSAFVEARQLDPLAHLAMQAALQPYVDNAISKTINVAADIPFERFADLYRQAHALGLKGCTVFRPNAVTGAILSEPAAERVQCCGIEREAD